MIMVILKNTYIEVIRKWYINSIVYKLTAFCRVVFYSNRITWKHNINVKNGRSRLNIFILLAYFYFIFDLVSLIPFLELELGLEQQGHMVTQQVTLDNMVTSHMIHERV